MKSNGLRHLRIWTIVALGLLTVQGFTGDTANLFSVFPIGAVSHSLNGLVRAIAGVGGVGGLEAYHAIEGAVLFFLSILVLVLAFQRASRERPA